MGNPIRLTQTATLLHGDVIDMMGEHVASDSIDLAIADVPYFVRGPTGASATSAYIHRNGMKTRFNEAWDRFDSIEQSTRHFALPGSTTQCAASMRKVLLFIFGTYHNLG